MADGDDMALGRTPTVPIGISPAENKALHDRVHAFQQKIDEVGMAIRYTSETQSENADRFYTTRMVPLESRVALLIGIASAAIALSITCLVVIVLLHTR